MTLFDLIYINVDVYFEHILLIMVNLRHEILESCVQV